MRLVVCGLSAVLLSGCSWLGGSGQSYNQKYLPKYSPQGQVAHQAPRAHNPCVVYSPVQPVPPGCDPSMVTLATGTAGHGGQMHGASYATGGYGSHAGQAGYAGHKPAQRLKKPRLRGALSLGVEKSYSGTLLEPGIVPALDPSATYDPTFFNEGFTEGSIASGAITDTLYSAAIEQVNAPTVSFDDVYTTPVKVSAGLEYILSPKLTVFANGGYAYAEGNDGSAISVDGTLLRTVSTQAYDTTTNQPVGGPVTNTSFIPNQEIANFTYDFSDMRRYDLEVGARKYFNPIVRDQQHRTVTPFVGVSAGASHHSAVSATVEQRQLFYERAFEDGDAVFYDVVAPTNRVEIYDSEWLPNGSLTAGVEWQLTSGTALALESGVRYEKSRDYIGGAEGDSNISVPVTLRGSFNF